MKKILLSITVFFLVFSLSAQDVGVGQWKEHLSYRRGLSAAEGNGKVYYVSQSGIFVLNKSDNSMQRLSKINGLSDVEGVLVNFNKYNNKALIAYKNGNLDLIDNNTIINLADIKRKPIIGNKSINNIYFIDQYAYLACGFGIVVIDMDRIEVKDTYYIGPLGNSINVRDITSDDNYLYATTDAGIYRALRSNPNLANYTAWSLMPGLPSGIYNTITTFNNIIYTNFSKKLKDGTLNADTIYQFNGTSWSYFLGGTDGVVESIKNSDNQLVIVRSESIVTYNPDMTQSGYFSGYFSFTARPLQAVFDNTNRIWIADQRLGLVTYRSGSPFESFYPNGPSSSRVNGMSLVDNDLWVAPGGLSGGGFGNNLYFVDGLYSLTEGEWSNTHGNYPGIVDLDSIYDILDVLVDPTNTKRVYASTWGSGLLEIYNKVPIHLYNESNSTLRGLGLVNYNPIRTYGMAMDAYGSLWVTNSGVQSCISKKDGNGWHSINFSQMLGNSPGLGQILIDKNDQKWMVLTNGGGIAVYKGGITAASNTSNTKKMNTAIGSGALPSTNVFCLAEDKEGEIWVGSDKGIAVFYSPENVFTTENFDAQQIKLEQDGHIQLLLETEAILSIAIDDANRKWIATANSGVFLMSADGTKQIYHFDETNSPLFSNSVKSIVINHTTGEVYFGTSKGLISFRGTATYGDDTFGDVYAFPNPVKHDYDGPIAIKGLATNSTVKITDISGSLVFETKSEGGQAIWYGKNFKGERVSSGVYMVFCTNADGSEKKATKILVIN